VNVPLYQGGGVAARIRQAKETDNQLKKEVEDARLRVHADVISNWGILQSSGPAIASAQAAVAANKIALTGVREEEKVGQRTTLDVLDATRELLNSQIGLVSALRDRVVAEYSLYAAMGRMDAQTLGLPVPYYDPIEHYDIVKNKWLGLRPPAPPAPDE
jgi:outer membrane protein